MKAQILAISGACALAACSGGGGPDGPHGRLQIQAAAITALTGIGGACYTITVTHDIDGDPSTTDDIETVWTRADVCSDGDMAGVDHSYASGAPGGIAYVGMCVDGNPDGTTTNHVTIEQTAVYDDHGDPLAGWVAPPPYETDVSCEQDTDTAVKASFVVLEDAQQGSLDIKVTLGSIKCSAKVDCESDFYYPDGETPDDTDADTVVVALSCQGGDDFTNLYADAIEVTCDGTTVTIDPSDGPGELDPGGPDFVSNALSTEGTSTDGLTSYWNVAIGINPDNVTGNCYVSHLRMTASPSEDFDFGDFQSYPVITVGDTSADWISIFSQETGFACVNPLNGTHSGLGTHYVTGADLDGDDYFQSCLTADEGSDGGVDSDACDY